MRTTKTATHCALALLASLPLAKLHAQLPTAVPESVGFSSERLQALDAALHALVDDAALAGVSTLVARHGKVVHTDTYGMQDLAARTPLASDTIFRIYSMTKPITGVALMKLYEQGKWHPEEPLARHIPAFANVRVHAGAAASGAPELVAPKRAPTVGDVMSHTAGFTYGFFGDHPVDRLYQADNPLQAQSAQAFVDKLAKLPLAYQPGEQWRYSVSVDVQGYLVEQLSGKPLPQFMQDEIFGPLGMRDTGFNVPEAKLARLATVYGWDAEKGLVAQARDPNVTRVPGFASGGGGLYSTLYDYARFAQMLANGGELDGVRILSPSTVALMTANHLPDALMRGGFGIGFQQMRPGFGFGYDVAVFTDPHAVGSTTGKGSYLWDGAAGTWFWVDPENDVVFVGMIQRMMSMGGMPQIQNLSRALVYQALVDP
jgi:CubicO group peptidase (beta-lactamase class C family)